MPKADTDPLRRRVEAILESDACQSQDWQCNEDGDDFPVDRFDPAKAADALVNIVGPLVAACRAVVAYGAVHQGLACDNYDCLFCGAAIDEGEPHKPDCAYTMAAKVIAAIDGPGGAED
jgi:hypothetical protein